MITLHACLAAGLLASTCYATPPTFHPPPPALPAYATQQWIHYAASIIAGETVPDCEVCDHWIACTIKRDIEGGRHPWTLHPGRWHGYHTPSPTHVAAVETALHPQGCLDVPVCAYLGNLSDYRYWSASLARGVPSHIVGNARGAIVCIPPPSSATPTLAPNTSTTASTQPRQPPSPAPARPGPVCQSTGRRPGHADE